MGHRAVARNNVLVEEPAIAKQQSVPPMRANHKRETKPLAGNRGEDAADKPIPA